MSTIPFWMLRQRLAALSGEGEDVADGEGIPVDPRTAPLSFPDLLGQAGGFAGRGLGALGRGLASVGRTTALAPLIPTAKQEQEEDGGVEPGVATLPSRGVSGAALRPAGRGADPLAITDEGVGLADTPLFSDPEWEAMGGAGRMAMDKGRARAVMMPGGKLLFTNTQEYEDTEQGGREIPMSEARGIIQAGEGRPSSPTSDTMRALVRAASGTSPRVPTGGVKVGGVPYIEDTPKVKTFAMRDANALGGRIPRTGSSSGGGVSIIEGTPQQQLSIKLEDALGRVALADAEQAFEKAKMPAAERALLENRDVQTGSWLLNTFEPQMEKVQRDADAAVKLVNQTVTDPKTREAELRRIAIQRDDKLESMRAMAAVLMGIGSRR